MATDQEDEYGVLRPYFTARGWLELSNYEKLRFHNMKQNYEMMVEIGLDVLPPEFMRPRKNTAVQKRTSVDNDDEEWRPRKKPSTQAGKPLTRPSSRKKKSASALATQKKAEIAPECSTPKRPVAPRKVERDPKQSSVPPKRSYPKRSQPQKCYKEEVVPDDDHYIYCENCGEFNDASCPKHPLTVIEDITVAPRSRRKSRKSLPSGLAIGETTIVGAGLGVFAERLFLEGVRFGPYKGEIVDGAEAYNSGYAWEICADGKAIHYVDARNESKSNWMRYVNCARNENEQNLVAFQYFGQIYYRSFKPIPPGAELLVYYGKDYAHDLGIQRVFSTDSKKEIPTSVASSSSFECEECDRVFTIHIYLLKHLKRVHGHAIYFPREPDRPTRGIMSTQGTPYFIALKRLSTHAHDRMNANLKHDKETGLGQTDIPGDLPIGGVSLATGKACTTTVGALHDTDHERFSSVRNQKSGGINMTDDMTHLSGMCAESMTRSSDPDLCYESESTPELVQQEFKSAVTPHQCETCGQFFSTALVLRNHHLVHSSTEQHRCETSANSFTKFGHPKGHELIESGETCGKSSDSTLILKNDEVIQSGVKPHKSRICYKSLPEAGSLRRHKLMHSGGTPHQCRTCGKTFTRSTSLRSHERIHSGIKPHQCRTCGQSFTQSSSLRRHEKIHSGIKPHQCRTCGKTFTDPSALRGHERIHSGIKPHQCRTCGKTFTRSTSLRSHERIHSGIKPHQCRTCGKTFSRSSHLRGHERIHSGIKPHQCRTCGTTFSQSSNLRVHERIHSGIKPHQCRTCGKTFSVSSSLRVHEKIHSGIKPHQCRTCGKTFTDPSALRGHERIHSGIKPHQCRTCGKTFTRSTSLRSHERIHSGIKPHQCRTCGKTFSRSSHLRGHERIHSGIKPHQCRTCGTTFSQSSNLRVHERIHSGIKPHQCRTCGKTFSVSSTLRVHERIHSASELSQCKASGESSHTVSSSEAHQSEHPNEQ